MPVGGQSIPMLEYDMAPGISKTFRKEFLALGDFAKLFDENNRKRVDEYLQRSISEDESILGEQGKKKIFEILASADREILVRTWDTALANTDSKTYQACEAFIHNLNTMSSRAGAQVPFSSVNYGTGTTPEQRMVMLNMLKALDAGLGNGETQIFPIHVFKVKKSVNLDEGTPNHDLFKLACKVASRRLFPTFVFEDAPFNKVFYKEGDPNTEVATMGCRTRVVANVHGQPTTEGRGNLSFTTINLPRLALESDGNAIVFMDKVKSVADDVIQQLLERFEVQARRKVYNYPFLMGQGVWRDSENLHEDDEVREVIKHGTLTLGFIGLAEAMVALFGKHHGQDKNVASYAYDVVKSLRKVCDDATEKYQLNFSLIATPAEGLSGRFTRMDRKKFGIIQGVTDREFYTNSMHVPVYFPISIWKKIDIEAPYHELCNGGHISYVELDGDVSKNPEAFEAVIKYMADAGIGYGAVNVPVDFDPVCGYTGVIGDTCPRCGRKDGEKVSAERIHELRKKYHR